MTPSVRGREPTHTQHSHKRSSSVASFFFFFFFFSLLDPIAFFGGRGARRTGRGSLLLPRAGFLRLFGWVDYFIFANFFFSVQARYCVCDWTTGHRFAKSAYTNDHSKRPLSSYSSYYKYVCRYRLLRYHSPLLKKALVQPERWSYTYRIGWQVFKRV